jgi:hypothetical protein
MNEIKEDVKDVRKDVKKILILPFELILTEGAENISRKYSKYTIAIGLNLFKVSENLCALIEKKNSANTGNNKKDMHYLVDVSEIAKKYVNFPFCVDINCKNFNEFISVEDKFKLLAQNRFLLVSSGNAKILKYIKNNYESVIVFMTAISITMFYFFAEIGFNFLLKMVKGDAVLIPERSGLVKLSGNVFLSKLKQFDKSIFIYTDKNVENLNYDNISGYYLLIS